LPLWEPNKTFSFNLVAAAGCVLAAGAPVWLYMPARKPFSQARCAGVNGAVSGIKGIADGWFI
jgi:hypothetical protein